MKLAAGLLALGMLAPAAALGAAEPARRAEYYDGEQRVELIGDARVWREDNVVTGEQITIFVNQDRSVVQGGKQERVKAIFYPKEENQTAIQVAKKQPECNN